MHWKAALAAIVFIAIPHYAAANELWISVEVVGIDNTDDVRIDVLSEHTVEPAENNKFRVLTDTMPSLTTPVVVTAENTPPGSFVSRLQVGLPFNADITSPLAIPVAINSRRLIHHSDVTMATGLAEGNSAFSSLLALNLVARQAYLQSQRGMSAVERPPGEEDARAAFVYVLTAKELAIDHFVQPDAEMLEATAWLRQILVGNPDLARRLLPGNDYHNAVLAVEQFSHYATIQRNKLMDALDVLMRAALRGSGRDLACALALELDTLFAADEAEDAASSLDRRVRNTENLLICATWQIKSATDAAELDMALAVATWTIEEMQRLLAGYGGATAATAHQRTQELLTVIAYYSAQGQQQQ